jgi:hypothetical protein
LAVFKAGVELVNADAGGAEIGVMAFDAVLSEEGFDGLFEGLFEGFLRAGWGLGGEGLGFPDYGAEEEQRQSGP